MIKKWRVKKLSTALRQSLDDLRKVERRKKYVVNMMWFHEKPGFIHPTRCAVCLAGARMVGLGTSINSSIGPGNFDDHTAGMLYAMDYLRMGAVGRALGSIQKFSSLVDPYSLDRFIPEYEDDRKGWWKAMRKLQKDLLKAGL